MKACPSCATTFDRGAYCPTCHTFVADAPRPAGAAKPPLPFAPRPASAPSPTTVPTPTRSPPGNGTVGGTGVPWTPPTGAEDGWSPASPSGPSGAAFDPVGRGPSTNAFGPGPFPNPATGPYGAPAGGPYRGPAAGPYAGVAAPPSPSGSAPTDCCRVCGATPALPVMFTQGIGMVMARRTFTARGPFCRDCGRNVGRSYLDKTLMLGWWGVLSFFLNFAHILTDAGALAKLRSLPEPTGGNPTQRLHPGRPIYQRAGVYVVLGIVVVVSALMINSSISTHPPSATLKAKVGQCVTYTGSKSTFVPCSGPHSGRVTAAGSSEADCPSSAESTLQDPAGSGVLCVDENQ